MARQPFQHDLLIALSAPTQAWSQADGQVRPGGISGWYHSDVRVLSQAILTIAGEEPETIASGPAGQGAVEIIALSRAIDQDGADPTTRLVRRRSVVAGMLRETIEFTSACEAPISAHVEMSCASDLAPMETVKSGLATTPHAPASITQDSITWGDGAIKATLTSSDATITASGPCITLGWDVVITPGETTTISFEITAEDAKAVVRAPSRDTREWSAPTIDSPDNRVARLVTQALDDLASLRMSTIDSPQDTFFAAGAPWFFTLFGRDSIIAARLLLPLTTEIAAGTLRTLARRQGRAIDPASAEQPGKILHEIRRETLRVDERTELPPVYFGTIDATALWISLLHDAWKAGMADDDVADLLEPLENALGWMRDHGSIDGFLSYIDESGHGLANQGWKDSGDSVQFRDGRLADGPIALVEVQAYAHKAALDGAALLDAFGRDGSPWRAWAAELSARFRARFWSSDEMGAYLVIALDGHGKPVDTVTSNMGHVLGSGLLTPDEAATIAARLVDSSMSSGYGLRTMSTTSKGYWPLKYHGGSVWPHDTAVVIEGLLAEGFTAEAQTLARGLLDAAEDFDFRLPELFAGDAAGTVPTAVPYPASCRPQAWSAASAISIAKALGAL